MPIKRSKYEDTIFRNVKDGAKIEYESTVFDYTVDYKNTIDVTLITKSGKRIYIELKGGNSYKYFNNVYRKRWKAMYEQHKDTHDIRLICQKDFKIGKVLTVSGWAAKVGVPIHIGTAIPEEWINE